MSKVSRRPRSVSYKILLQAVIILGVGSGLAFIYNTFTSAGIPLQMPTSVFSGQYVIDTKGYPSLGAENAPITVVVFSDFQCPFSQQANPMLNQALVRYAGTVRVVFRHFPLARHKDAQKAHEAAACAHAQGKFWAYHDRLFANQNMLDVKNLKMYAHDARLDLAQFDQCLNSGQYAGLIEKDIEVAKQYGVVGTPSFFINGTPRDIQTFEQLAWYITEGKDGKLIHSNSPVASSNVCQ